MNTRNTMNTGMNTQMNTQILKTYEYADEYSVLKS